MQHYLLEMLHLVIERAQHNVNDSSGNPMSAYTLNEFNFQAAYPFLIPKAVGYSAGLIDYFFRCLNSRNSV